MDPQEMIAALCSRFNEEGDSFLARLLTKLREPSPAVYTAEASVSGSQRSTPQPCPPARLIPASHSPRQSRASQLRSAAAAGVGTGIIVPLPPPAPLRVWPAASPALVAGLAPVVVAVSLSLSLRPPSSTAQYGECEL